MGEHYVPQYYLHGFGRDGRLWAHDRAEGRSFRAQPKAVPNENAIYEAEIEAYFTEHIEQPAQGAIDKVRALAPLDAEEREALARYLVALWKRVPRARERALAQIPDLAASLRRDVLADLEQIAEREPALAPIAKRRHVEVTEVTQRFEATPPADIWRRSLKEPAAHQVIAGLLSMQWRYLVASSDMLLACDNPVFFFAHEGIGAPQAEVTVAVSSHVALWANRRPFPETLALVASRQAMRELQRRACYNATRFVFSEADAPWVLPLHQRKHWSLTRLR